MSDLDESTLSVEQIDRDLAEIEEKYSPVVKELDVKCLKFQEILRVLSKEFDSLGLPPLDLSQEMPELFHQVLVSSRSLVQMHRGSVALIKDKNIEHKQQNTKNNELFDTLDDYKKQLERLQKKCNTLQNTVSKLNDEIANLRNQESVHKEEIARLKRHYLAKQNELQHNLKRITKENGYLKETFGKDITTPNSTNEVALKLLEKHRRNEEIYKSTIKKLQGNNEDLLHQILNLKEDLILCKCKQ